ncbi:MAG: cation diffusion facilitator family transporter [Acidobacteriota bacterium]
MTEAIPTAAGAHKKRLLIVFALTGAYMIAEVVGGLLTHSLALMADAGHMVTDVAGIGLALLAIRFAERPATPEKTYGYYRLEILAALANTVVLIGISIYILVEAYQRFRNPPEVQTGTMLVVAGIGLGVNVAGVLLLRGGSSKSLNLKGAYFEVLSDLLTSVGVIIAALVMMTTRWYYADPLISAGIGLFILPRTWTLLREAIGVLLEGTPKDVDVQALREAVGRIQGAEGVHDLHVWTLTSGVNAMSVHVVLSDRASHDDVLKAVQKCITSAFKIAHVTVQLEPIGCAEWETHL